MARKRMVTRSIKSTELVVLSINVEDRTTFEQSMVISGTYPTREKAFKVVQKLYDDENVKPISIVSMNEVERLYGMTEQEFISSARILPPRNVKTGN